MIINYTNSTSQPSKCCLLGNRVDFIPLWPVLQGHWWCSYYLKPDPMSLSGISHLPNNPELIGFNVTSFFYTEKIKILAYHLKHLRDESEGRNNLIVSGWLLTYSPLVYHISYWIQFYMALFELMLHWFWFMYPNGHYADHLKERK